ncbi:MAG TPA: serine hydrolase [Thermoleophilaceae bacterium]|nr:serine hydrolase [Thermoleophilaceae bacterium]
MRRSAAVLAAIAVLAAAGPAAAAPDLERWRPGLEAARAYAAQRIGTISFAVRTPRRLYRSDAQRVYRSASVVKAMLMVAYLNHESVRGRPLNAADHALLNPMVRWSDNLAATRVRELVGNGALERLADRVGMRRFATMPSWGDTQITAAGQSKLFLRIDRYVVRRHRDTALRLLGAIVPEQRWGIARVPHPGWRLHFKGGWGDYGEVDHQIALLRRGKRRIAVAILSTAFPSHEYGKRTLEGIARRLLHGLGPRSNPR